MTAPTITPAPTLTPISDETVHAACCEMPPVAFCGKDLSADRHTTDDINCPACVALMNQNHCPRYGGCHYTYADGRDRN